MVTVPINRKYNIGRHVGSVMNPPLRQGRRVHDRPMNSPKQTRRSVNAIRFHESPAETNAPKVDKVFDFFQTAGQSGQQQEEFSEMFRMLDSSNNEFTDLSMFNTFTEWSKHHHAVIDQPTQQRAALS